ncbi:SPOR domain-containing protein [Lacinutrix sp. Bg11-31]|uniref:SPOR domain-containing protein n=1 Tax=Lacinutrix sp. Bg11-31 TaxID=2057808 RepID=UPI000C31A38B|nr:SPOR domain-containing protein [Lacinutrix sp. Bg11-31]AUC83280.1 translation initiation factor IF-2 [Lacinutrix sp. Bg11-31]
MNIKSLKILCLSLGLTFSSCIVLAQQGTVIVNQDPEITALLKLKKQINNEDEDSDRYKIQIYSGSRAKAESTENSFDGAYNSWSSKLVYETPNYKIWVGSFRTRLEADKALKKIKNKFPSAFIFKPKKRT